MEKLDLMHHVNMRTSRSIFALYILLVLCFVTSSFISSTSNPHSDCNYNFENDLKANSIKLFLIGGISPTHVQGQEQHEKRFSFVYYDFGCLPDSEICTKEYSAKAFKYLDSKYGKLWRNFVRQDVLYLRGKNHL